MSWIGKHFEKPLGARCRRPWPAAATVAAAVSLVAGCAVAPPRPRSYWPTQGWQTATPETHGIDSATLAQAVDTIRLKNLPIHSLLIVRHGDLVLEAYFYPYRGRLPHDVASVTKSVTTSLIGIAVDQGILKGVNQPLLSFFPEVTPKNLDGRKRGIRLKHLMSMSSGLRCGLAPGEPELTAMMQTDHWVQAVLDLPMANRPGTQFAYCSGGMHLLSAVIGQAAGTSAEVFARSHLFEPLGIEQVVWPADPQGVSHGWGDLGLLPRDMAKIGFLFLNQGQWSGQQVVSADWTRQATRRRMRVPGGGSDYGYGWWTLPNEMKGAYEANGRGGQRITVWPQHDLVVVFTGAGFDPNEVGQLLLPSIQSSEAMPPNPSAQAALRKAIEAAARAPEPAPAPPLPEVARRISGKTWRFEQNHLGFENLTLNFNDPVVVQVKMTALGQAFTLPIGLDRVQRRSTDGPRGMLFASAGHWEGDGTFAVQSEEIAGPNDLRLRFAFTPDHRQVKLTLRNATGPIPFAEIIGSLE